MGNRCRGITVLHRHNSGYRPPDLHKVRGQTCAGPAEGLVVLSHSIAHPKIDTADFKFLENNSSNISMLRLATTWRKPVLKSP